MARYRAKTDGFVNGERVRAGREFVWDGKPGKWMEPLDVEKSGKPAKAGKSAKGKEPDGDGGGEGLA